LSRLYTARPLGDGRGDVDAAPIALRPCAARRIRRSTHEDIGAGIRSARDTHDAAVGPTVDAHHPAGAVAARTLAGATAAGAFAGCTVAAGAGTASAVCRHPGNAAASDYRSRGATDTAIDARAGDAPFSGLVTDLSAVGNRGAAGTDDVGGTKSHINGDRNALCHESLRKR